MNQKRNLVIVQNGSIVVSGRKFSSSELPANGTEVEVDEFTAFGNLPAVHVAWSGVGWHSSIEIVGYD